MFATKQFVTVWVQYEMSFSTVLPAVPDNQQAKQNNIQNKTGYPYNPQV